MKKIRIITPASTSNIGPGFDTLGIALKLYNRLDIAESEKNMEIEFERGVEDMFCDGIRRMVRRTVGAFTAASGKEISGVRLVFRSDIPIARGLGSSATFRMGTLVGLNEWAGKPLDRDALLEIGCRIEKHTENSVAGTVGGLTASGFINGHVQYARFDIAEKITFIAAVPERPMSTSETRKILPRRVNFSDAVFNINRTALLIDAFSSGKYDRLAELLEDKLHQPHRAKILRPLFKVIAAAREAGAWGAFLSGSGSTIMAVATKSMENVKKAMQSKLDEEGWPSKMYSLKTDLKGISVDHR